MAEAKKSGLNSIRKSARNRLHLREIKGDEAYQNETVGADLRAARLRLGHDLGSVAEAIRIKVEHLKAIEEGDIQRLPGMTYALGFVRSYANFVGLGADECIRRFKAEATQRQEMRFSSITRSEEGGFPFATLGIVVIVVLLSVLGWFVASMALNSGQPLEEVVSPETLLVDEPLAEAPLVTTSPELVSLAEGKFEPFEAPLEALPEGTAWGSENFDGRIRLRAREEVWIRVEMESRVLFERSLQPGDSYTAPKGGAILLSTRNAGALDLFVDNTYLGRIGRSGTMSAGLALNADELAPKAQAQ
ncbi:MAG: DUF4115 domain-containing protein [Alphaproteobacteria bacterium]|nr:MAG: DUF4115 domain-containing protein [Alphaproteobacteria bacterium]